jgi:hypothetical protein
MSLRRTARVLPAQPGNAAPTAVIGQAEFLGPQEGPPGSQEFAELCPPVQWHVAPAGTG